MGSVREGSEAMADAVPELGLENADGVPAPANPLPNQGPGTPPGTPPVTPPKGESSDVPALPSTHAGDESKAKKARLEETQETVAQLADLVQNTLNGMKELHETVKLNNQQQKELQAEIDQLAKQMNCDAVTEAR